MAALVAATLPLLVGLARSLGFRNTPGLSWTDHIADGLVGYAVGTITATTVLGLFGLVGPLSPDAETVGMIAIESVPASIGAVIARGQFGGEPREATGGSMTYLDEVLLMAVGAGVFAFNIAPTEEVVLIATTAGPARAVALALITMALMHALVYVVGFRGQHRSDAPGWSILLGYTVAGYATALAVALVLLWTFGRTDAVPMGHVALEAVVLGFPAGLGAAAARLVL